MVMKAFLALEEQAYQDNGVNIAAYDPERSVGNALLATQDASASLDQQVAELDEGQHTADTLDTLRVRIEQTLPDGGLSEPVAAALNTAVEHLVSRLGSRRKVMPSMESFGAVSRKRSTELALEGIKEIGASIYNAIIEAFRKLGAWIKKLFGFSKQTKEALKKETAELKGVIEKNKAQGGAEGKLRPLDAKTFTLLCGAAFEETMLNDYHIVASYDKLYDRCNEKRLGKIDKCIDEIIAFGEQIAHAKCPDEQAADALLKSINEEIYDIYLIADHMLNPFGTIGLTFKEGKYSKEYINTTKYNPDQVPYCSERIALQLAGISSLFSDLVIVDKKWPELIKFIDYITSKISHLHNSGKEEAEKEINALRAVLSTTTTVNTLLSLITDSYGEYVHAINQYIKRGVRV